MKSLHFRHFTFELKIVTFFTILSRPNFTPFASHLHLFCIHFYLPFVYTVPLCMPLHITILKQREAFIYVAKCFKEIGRKLHIDFWSTNQLTMPLKRLVKNSSQNWYYEKFHRIPRKMLAMVSTTKEHLELSSLMNFAKNFKTPTRVFHR